MKFAFNPTMGNSKTWALSDKFRSVPIAVFPGVTILLVKNEADIG